MYDFFSRHEDFYLYFKQERTENDQQYFLRANTNQENFPVIKCYDEKPETVTSHDRLVASIMARERYVKYIHKKLKKV